MRKMNQWKKCMAMLMASAMLVTGGSTFVWAGDSSAETAGEESGSGTHTITDANGNPVEIPETINSVAAISWPWPAMVFAVSGDASSIKSMPAGALESYNNCIFKTLAPGLENVNTDYLGSDKTLNYEELAKIQPDIMLMYESEIEKMGEQLEKVGVTPVLVNYGKLQDVQDSMRVLGEIYHTEERAESMIKLHKDAIAAVESKQEEFPAKEDQTRVLYLYGVEGDGTYRIYAGTSLGQDYLNMVGGVNVAEELEITQTTVNMEQILEWNPDVILLSNFDDFMPEDFAEGNFGGNDWSSIEAIKNGRVYKVPMGIYRWDPPCAESHIMLEWMAQLCNPEIFSEFDIRGDLKDFYKTYFDHDLTEEEMDQILYSKSNVGLNC
ncbi:ABC transporter substrate-binding protein [Ruminococcus sp. 5_1_39BFAA]|uniref:ABC transporter substrate-binding protein n=1 Tax=Ruminococcus sp. 5_1_39BFAA TaxID=457412 RepID=UPI003563B3B8